MPDRTRAGGQQGDDEQLELPVADLPVAAGPLMCRINISGGKLGDRSSRADKRAGVNMYMCAVVYVTKPPVGGQSTRAASQRQSAVPTDQMCDAPVCGGAAA